MPLQINTLSPTTPFLKSYTPYQTPSDTRLADAVDDMISYNLTTSNSLKTLNYSVGAEGSYQQNFTIKNLTTNVVLDIEVSKKTDAFFINLSPLQFSLNPLQTKTFSFALNKQYLNAITTKSELDAYVNIVVKNRKNGSIALRDVTTSVITPEKITSNINVV